LIMFGTVAASGIRGLARAGLGGRHDLLIVAATLAVGLVPLADPDFYRRLPGWSQVILHSGITTGSAAAILLNAFLNGAAPAGDPPPPPPPPSAPSPPDGPTPPTPAFTIRSSLSSTTPPCPASPATCAPRRRPAPAASRWSSTATSSTSCASSPTPPRPAPAA